jgi:DNA-binding XRE family transcriptional regulator
MDDVGRRVELKAFLRAHRARVTPEAAGFVRASRGPAHGLRREELAALAGVSLTWYTWLEQGREINVSAETLHRIARALHLTTSDETYLFTLAGLPAPHLAVTSSTLPESLQSIVHGFVGGLAVACDSIFNVLAYNRIADVVFSFDAYDGPLANNHLARAFLDPARRRLYGAEWEPTTRRVVGVFRTRAALSVGRPEYEQFVSALQKASPDFARMWNDQETEPLSNTQQYGFDHPRLGHLTLKTARLLFEGFDGFIAFLLPADADTAVALVRGGSRASTERPGNQRSAAAGRRGARLR